MPIKKLKSFLDENGVKYVTIRHSSAYTAQEIAAKTHVAGKEFAKTVIIRVGNKLTMTVLPASYQLDFDVLEEIFGTRHVSLATEEEFKYMFPDCEVGAMPPFGNLYDMEVFVAESLAEDEEIAFTAGNHTEMMKLKYKDFERLVEPRIFKFSKKTISFPGDPRERWAEN